MSNTLYVGDIHGQVDQLLSLLDDVPNDTRLVFLGDINDSRMGDPDLSNSWETYRIVRRRVEQGDTLVHSNHQRNLINVLSGNRTVASHGMSDTLFEFQKLGKLSVATEEGQITHLSDVSDDLLEMIDWLSKRPYYDYDADKNTLGIHAQWIPGDNQKSRQAALYGTTRNHQRIKWWETYTDTPYVISGHYHELWLGEFCSVIDGGCGGPGGQLVALLVTSDGQKEVYYY